jgi:hypothetical protein
VNEPISHTWKHADPTAKIKYSVRLKNFGATIKGKIYLGDNIKPQNTNPLWDPPSEGNSQDYNINCPNDCGVIGSKAFTQQLTFRRETTNEVIATLRFTQNVYWTFGTPQIDINEARIALAISYAFANETSTLVISQNVNQPVRQSIIGNMIPKYLNFNLGNCIVGNPNKPDSEMRIWDRAKNLFGGNSGTNLVPGVDCISHAEFYKRICLAAGLQADFGSQTWIAEYATANERDRPKIGIFGNFGWYTDKDGDLRRPPLGPEASNATDALAFQAIQQKRNSLTGDYLANRIFIDDRGAGNNFEAVLIISTRGTTPNVNDLYYVPGGRTSIYSVAEKNKVIYEVMKSLEWQFYEKKSYLIKLNILLNLILEFLITITKIQATILSRIHF